jgi:sigma-54 dependent tetracycline resistance transcriptional regulator
MHRGPFIAVNCGSISKGLVSSELFGHVKGAFTGASDNHKGYIQRARNGTLFLDEIGEMPLDAQGHLLHFLESKEVTSVGSDRVIEVDCRVITATNVILKEAILNKTFRSDLFYRLNVLPLTIPTLRERVDDILPLANFFLVSHSSGRSLRFSVDAVECLNNYAWPGNVRELKNVIRRAIVLAESEVIYPCDFALDSNSATERSNPANLKSKYIEQVILTHRYNISAAAKSLGISRPTLYRLMKKHNIRLLQ